MALSNTDLVTQLYIGYYNRAPDPTGLQFWLNALNSGETITQVANQFANSSESTALYPFLTLPGVVSPTSFVTSVYNNVLNRAPDAAGLAFWTAQLSAGTTTAGNFIATLEASVNMQVGTADATVLANKLTVAEDYTSRVAAANVAFSQTSAHAVLAPVSGVGNTPTTPAEVTTAEAVTTAFVSQGGSTPTVTAFTTGTDNITGSTVALTGVVDGTIGAGNQSTIQVFDQVNPGGTTNTIAITHVNGTGLSSSNLPVLNNVQTISETNQTGALDTFSLTGVAPNAVSIGVSNGSYGVTFSGFNGTQTNTFNVLNQTSDVANGYVETFQPNAGLITAGKASGSASVNVSNTPSQTLKADNVGIALVGATTNDGYSTVTLNSVGSVANDIASLTSTDGTNTLISTLNITGTQKITVDGNIAFAGTSGIVNVQAANDAGGFAIDVSGNTGKATVVGGSGVDSVTISNTSLLVSGTSLNGGTGATNTLTVAGYANSTLDVTAINAITGFHTLGINAAGPALSTATAPFVSLATNNITSVTDFLFSGAITTGAANGAGAGQAAVSVTGELNNQTFDFTASDVGQAGFTASNGGDAIVITPNLDNGSNVLNLTFGTATSTGLAITGGASGSGATAVGGHGLDVAQFETVNIVANGTSGADVFTGGASAAGTAGAGLWVETNSTVNISGTEAVTFTTISGVPQNGLLNVSVNDTGSGAFTASFLQAGNDSFVSGTGGSNVTFTAAGVDTVTLSASTAKTDTIALQSGANETASALHSITGFTNSATTTVSDVLALHQAGVTAVIAGPATNVAFTDGALSTTYSVASGILTLAAPGATLQNYLDAAVASAGANHAGSEVAFQLNGNTYVVETGTNTAHTVFAAATDIAVNLVGLTGVTALATSGSVTPYGATTIHLA